MVQQHWVVAMLLMGAIFCWWLYLMLYSAPEAPRLGEEPPGGQEQIEIHQFPEGITETHLPVPASLKLFFLIMAIYAVGYVLWIRFQVVAF